MSPSTPFCHCVTVVLMQALPHPVIQEHTFSDPISRRESAKKTTQVADLDGPEVHRPRTTKGRSHFPETKEPPSLLTQIALFHCFPSKWSSATWFFPVRGTTQAFNILHSPRQSQYMWTLKWMIPESTCKSESELVTNKTFDL